MLARPVAPRPPALATRPRLIARASPLHPRRAVATSAASSAADGVTGDMLAPSAFNTPLVRVLAIGAAALGGSALTAAASPGAGPALLHLVAWGTGLGTAMYTTFFLGIAMFKNLPRQVFGRLQAKLFPIYFMLLAATSVLQAASLALGPGLARPQALTLGVGLAATLANLLIVEPASTRSMFERYELEGMGAAVRDEARVAALRKEFGKLHGLSSMLNLVAVVTAIAHGAWLAGGASLAPVGEVLVRVAVRK